MLWHDTTLTLSLRHERFGLVLGILGSLGILRRYLPLKGSSEELGGRESLSLTADSSGSPAGLTSSVSQCTQERHSVGVC